MKGNFGQENIRVFEDGEAIFREGETSQEMFIVQQGEVVVEKKSNDASVHLATLKRGDFLGEMSLLESLPRSATAIAKGKTKLISIQPGGFLLKIRRDPTFAFELMQALSHRIRHTNEKLLNSLNDGELDPTTLKKILEQGSGS